MKATGIKMLGLALAVAGCSAGEPESRPLGRQSQKVEVADEAKAKFLSSKKTSKPRLCQADTCLVPELGTDLDAFKGSEESLVPEACYDGQHYCDGARCWACCNNTWYNMNTGTGRLHLYCNGEHFQALQCWPCCE
jgi:hypothetical protein